MKKEYFTKEFIKIQTFLGLWIWNIHLNELENELENENETETVWRVIYTDYSRFNATIFFSIKYIKKSSKEDCLKLIFHELCHIYTTSTLFLYEDDEEFYIKGITESAYIWEKQRMIILNEQQTELLSRVFYKLYINK